MRSFQSLCSAGRALVKAVGFYKPCVASSRPIAGVHLGAGFCTKPQENKSASESQSKESGYSFKVPGHKPTDWEKKILLWGGRFKKEADIPEIVSFEMIDAAKNKVRVKVSYIMIVLTIMGCITMVVSGKRAVRRHESLAGLNLEKKARLREESQAADIAKAE